MRRLYVEQAMRDLTRELPYHLEPHHVKGRGKILRRLYCKYRCNQCEKTWTSHYGGIKLDLTKLVGDHGPAVKFRWKQKCSRCSNWWRPYCVEVGSLRKSLKSSLRVILAKYYSLLQPRLPSLNTKNTRFEGFVTSEPQAINSFATGIVRKGQAAEMVVREGQAAEKVVEMLGHIELIPMAIG